MAPTYDLAEKERCQVCGRERLKFFSKDHCQHTPEEWDKASAKRIIGTLAHQQEDKANV